MEMYGEVEVLLYASLTLLRDEDEWSASSPGRFTPEGKTFSKGLFDNVFLSTTPIG
jgi:hypothetical protein